MTQPAFGVICDICRKPDDDHYTTSAAVPPPPQRVCVVAQFTAGDLTWGQLRAIVALAANNDRETVHFDQEDDRADGMVGGIHLEIAAP